MAADHKPITITFKLEGSPKDDGLVRASDFATFLDGALAVLRALEREATDAKQAKIEFRITQLEIGSASLAMEAIDSADLREAGSYVIARFTEGLAALHDGRAEIASFRPAARSALSKMISPLRRSVRSIAASVGDRTITLVGKPSARADVSIATEELAVVGSFAGSVDALNVHGDHFFYLYPPVGPTRIRCVFDSSLLDEVKKAVKRHTTVHGLIEYVEPSNFPTRIVVDRIEVHPFEANLPSLDELWGILPELTDGLDDVAFIQQVRDVD